MGGKKSESARRAANARWGGRGPSSLIRVDVDAAEALKRVPVDVRRAVASEAIMAAVAKSDEMDRAMSAYRRVQRR